LAVPQLIDEDLYREVFGVMLGSRDDIGRLYVSLCVQKIIVPGTSWTQAAGALGLDGTTGARTARAASGRMRVPPDVFATTVQRTLSVLPHNRDFRALESSVRSLAGNLEAWVQTWRTSTSPLRRETSVPYAVTWMWCEVAQGWLEASPGWRQPPTRFQKAAYRQFRDGLPTPAQQVLRSLVVDQLIATLSAEV
jgi:hypothetical protein